MCWALCPRAGPGRAGGAGPEAAPMAVLERDGSGGDRADSGPQLGPRLCRFAGPRAAELLEWRTDPRGV